MTVFFNSVWGPDRFCLRFLDTEELTRILDCFAMAGLPGETALQRANRGVFEELVEILGKWRDEARERGKCLGRSTLLRLLAEASQTDRGSIKAKIAAAMRLDVGYGLDGDPLAESRRLHWPSLAGEYGYISLGLAYLEQVQKVREATCGADAAFARKMSVVERDLRASADPATFAATLVQLGIRWCLDMIESGDEHMLIWRMLDAR